MQGGRREREMWIQEELGFCDHWAFLPSHKGYVSQIEQHDQQMISGTPDHCCVALSCYIEVIGPYLMASINPHFFPHPR